MTGVAAWAIAGPALTPDPLHLLHPAPAAAQCIGDCNESGMVEVFDLMIGLNIALGTAPLSSCRAWDADKNHAVTVIELVKGIGQALSGCPVEPPFGCGNESIDGQEQCDDGNNADGDGCSRVCTIEGPGPLDRNWVSCSPSSEITSGGSIGIVYAQPIGQEFFPSQPTLSGVAVRVEVDNRAGPNEPLTVRIHGDTLDGPLLGEATADVSESGPQLFIFAPALVLVPDGRYVVELSSPSVWLSWQRAGGPAAECEYPGRPIFFGVPEEDVGNNHEDLIFQTFAAP